MADIGPLAHAPMLGAVLSKHGDHVSIPTDDAPEDLGPRLHILAHDDYYVTVSEGPSAGWPTGDAIRFCLSGARNPILTSIVAGMYFAIRGDRARAIDCLKCAIAELRPPQ